MTPRLSALLSHIEPVARREILKDFMPDCCIATAAILRRVFRHFGFDARPVVCSVIIRNRKFVDAIKAGHLPPDNRRDLVAWMEAHGAYSLGIVPESATNAERFGGHVLVLVQDVVVDASLGFASRPDHDIIVPDFIVFTAQEMFLDRKAELVGRVGAEGAEFTYRRIVDNSFRSAPDWTNERRARRAVNAIIDQVVLRAREERVERVG